MSNSAHMTYTLVLVAHKTPLLTKAKHSNLDMKKSPTAILGKGAPRDFFGRGSSTCLSAAPQDCLLLG